ncbi:hypothetical protein [Myxococcus sp. RHSTA-1-4]|uniref:hypothetical protein n=1 Tax=Myxococcus sp. RHSTA-1-4 TaxID=2874601 RepID=UPI001CBBB65A|nr:hypothetical protein [Myxococcus sp. RHSTA-1-4]MBZ4416721.1 hypothetical protein [Myxococcus sp. RHSTA-1-4]
MRRLGHTLLAVSLLAGCGPGESEPSSTPSLARQDAPLTTTDVDVAPECQGILTFVNTASFETLDAYLPSDVASNLVARRSTAPFVTLAEVSAVNLVGSFRLTQIETGARALGYIDSTCVGILDELALSTDDASAMVSLVNNASASTLYAVLPNAWNGATNLINLRPFTSVQAISNTTGIGAVSLRNLRNAATMGYSLEVLVSAVNALPEDEWTVKLDLSFEVADVIAGEHGNDYGAGGTCFGLDPSTFPSTWTNRPTLATATEVRDYVTGAVSTASSNHPVSSEVVAEGLADLEARIAGRTFKGCHLSYSNGPWAGIQVHFFVDTETGFRILTEQHWVE